MSPRKFIDVVVTSSQLDKSWRLYQPVPMQKWVCCLLVPAYWYALKPMLILFPLLLHTSLALMLAKQTHKEFIPIDYHSRRTTTALQRRIYLFIVHQWADSLRMQVRKLAVTPALHEVEVSNHGKECRAKERYMKRYAIHDHNLSWVYSHLSWLSDLEILPYCS